MIDVSESNSKAGQRRARLDGRIAIPDIEVQFGISRSEVPHPDRLRCWAGQALAMGQQATGNRPQSRAIALRVVDAAEGRRLNRLWRGKDQPTNVLSFPAGELRAMDAAMPLGDIVLCAPVIRREAGQQSKLPAAHWAHMVVHGVLHLLGFDHEKQRQANVMEHLEREVLAQLGYPDPYREAQPR